MEIPAEIIRKLEEYARLENRTPLEVLDAIVERYTPQPPPAPVDPVRQAEELRQVRRRLYDRARRYWQEHDDPRASMTNAELDEQFWLFDYEGVPRLKSEQATLDLPPSSLDIILEDAENIDLGIIETDITERSRDILNTEFADYLLNRMNRPATDE